MLRSQATVSSSKAIVESCENSHSGNPAMRLYIEISGDLPDLYDFEHLSFLIKINFNLIIGRLTGTNFRSDCDS